MTLLIRHGSDAEHDKRFGSLELMVDTFPLWPVQASSIAGQLDLLYVFLLVLSAVTCAAIFTVIAVFAMKYRRRHGREAEQIHGSLVLEIAWSVIPLGVFLVIFAWGAVLYFHERTPPRDSTEVYTVAKQWMWKFQHPEGHAKSMNCMFRWAVT